MKKIDLLPKSMKGKYVSRAAFAKMQGEKQRLEKDIYVMVMGSIFHSIEVRRKYKEKFEKDKSFSDALRELLKGQMSKNNQKDVVQPPKGPNIEVG